MPRGLSKIRRNTLMKRLCILQTDSVLPEYQAAHGDYPDMFRRLLAGTHAEVMAVDVRNGPPEEVSDAYVITGSRHSVYEDLPWLPAFVSFLRLEIDRGAPVVGICFGHQLIAHYFGGEVRAADDGWAVGVHRAEVVAVQPWMQPSASAFSILSSHQDQVVRLPDGARCIASTPFCPVSGFVMGANVLCLQGHPEFEAGYARTLMNHRQALLGEQTYAAGLASLAEPLDDQLVAQWMLRLLRLPFGEEHGE